MNADIIYISMIIIKTLVVRICRMPKKLATIVLRQKSVRSVWKLECKSREIAFFIQRQLGREYDINSIMNIKGTFI